MAALRVLHVITQLTMGGAENQLLNLCRQLPRDRYEQRVASLKHEGVLIASFRESGIEVLTFDRDRLGGRRAQMQALAGEIRRWRPQVLQTWLRQANNLGRLAGLLGRRPKMVANYRDMGFDVVARDQFFDLAMEPFTDLYLHNSAMGREAFLRRVRTSPRRKHSLLPNGIDAGRFRPDPGLRAQFRRERGLAPEDAAVLMVSRLHPIKDPGLFLEVARQGLMMAGRRELSGAIEELGRRLELLGPGEEVQLPEGYAQLKAQVQEEAARLIQGAAAPPELTGALQDLLRGLLPPPEEGDSTP